MLDTRNGVEGFHQTVQSTDPREQTVVIPPEQLSFCRKLDLDINLARRFLKNFPIG